MFVVGLQCAGSAFLAAGFKLQLTLALVTLVIVVSLCPRPGPKEKMNAPATLPGLSILRILPFFRRRFDFMNEGFRSSGQPLFQFNLLRNSVIAVSGETGRKIFFGTKGFDLAEGFKVLSGAIPILSGVTTDLQMRRVTIIHKRLSALQRNASLTKLTPPMLEDCRRIMESYGEEGSLDPFAKVYELVFQITVRSLSCFELADDAVIVARLKLLYDKLDSGTTPTTVMLPWFPGPAMISKLLATKEIYDIVVRAIEARERSGIPRNDTLQTLLDAKDDRMVVVGFIMGFFIAGARATGTTASWLITFLGCHPEWQKKAVAEIETLLASHPFPSNEKPSLSAHLATIPISAWESQTPILDGFIRETLRLAQPHIAMRKNVGPDVYIGDKVVPSGTFLIYPFSDIHLNPSVYEDPWTFNPGRAERKDNDSEGEGAYEFVGWGAGKSVCAGQRIARIELKLIASMFLVGFDFSIVDHAGKPRSPSTAPNSVPKPNWNDVLLCRPPKGTSNVKYRRRPGVPL